MRKSEFGFVFGSSRPVTVCETSNLSPLDSASRAPVTQIPPAQFDVAAGSIGLSRSLKRTEFLGVPLDCHSIAEAVDLAAAAMRNRQRLQHGDVNVAKFVSFKSDPELRRYTAESDVICVDGMGIVWGCRLLGIKVPERVTGIDYMMQILEVCAREGFRPYFLGAKQDVLEETIAEVRRRHPALELAGWRNGYFRQDDEAGIVADIKAARADCIFVGISSPMKERFLNRYRDALGVPVQLGVGGSFDVLAGRVLRAPLWIQRAGFEWLWRLAQEPRRLAWRYATTNAQYIALVAVAVLRRVPPKRLLEQESA